MTSGKNLSKIEVLTSLRFFAAIVIILYHARQSFTCLHVLPEEIVYSQGVSFFFILSGFILTYVYRNFKTTRDYFFYLGKRIARLWPLHVATLLLYLLIVPAGMDTTAGTSAIEASTTLLLNFTMLQSWVPDLRVFFSYNAPSWSISTEFFFYLTLPFLLLGAKRFKWLPASLCALLTVSSIAVCNSFQIPGWSADGLSLQGLLAINPIARILEFALGMTAALIFKDYAGKRATNFVNATILEALTLIATIWAVFNSSPISASLEKLSFIGPAGAYWLAEAGIPLLPFTSLIFVFAFQRGLISKILSAGYFVKLGEISFALYLVHFPLLEYHSFYLPQEQSIEAFLIFLTILGLSSHLLYKNLEVPSRIYLTRKLAIVFSDEFRHAPDEPLSTKWKAIVLQGLSKRWLLTTAEVLSLIVLVVISQPTLKTISNAEAEASLDSAYCKLRKVNIEDLFQIRSLCAYQTDNYTVLDLVIECSKDQCINHFISVQMLDRDKKEHFLKVTRIAPNNSLVKSGTLWNTRIEIPKGSSFEEVTQMGLIVAGNRFLSIRNGKTDMDGKRLLIPLESREQISDSAKNTSPISY